MALHAKRKSAVEFVNELSGDYMYKISNEGLTAWKTSFNQEKRKSEVVPVRKQITFSWCNINVFTQPKKSASKGTILPLIHKNEAEKPKHILKNVSGIAHPGELLLIMGSSGAGKTTLLNCMTFRNLKGLRVSGLVCINNNAVTQTELAARSAYIQQDDMFIKYLTVKEHLIFQAQVRMDSHYTYEEKLERIEQVMKELSLKKCENCIIGLPGVIKGISGGERKRLAVASELLTKPSLLFCDEPTTGLDSFMSLNIVQMLKDIARSGRTVIVTLHQPSSELFHLFDNLCLMAEGRTAFLGSLEQAEPFFTKLHFPCPPNFNPADHYIQTLAIVPGKEAECRKVVNKICDSFANTTELGLKIKETAEKTVKSAKSSENWTHKGGAISPYRVGWYGQMKAVFWRSWLSIIKNPKMTTVKFYLTVVESLLIIAIYYGQIMNQLGIKNIDGVFFYVLTSSSFQNIFAVLDTFCEELPLFMKEHKDGMYRTDVYYIAKIICDLPFSILLMCFKTALLYYLVGLNPEPLRFFNALFISLLLGQAARGAGFVISTLAANMHFASVSVSFFVTPLMIFGGFYLSIKSVPIYLVWLSDLSWFKYAYEAFMINQWSDINSIQCTVTNTTADVCISNGMKVLQSQAINPGGFWLAVASLVALIVFFRLISFFVLLYKASCRV